MAGGNTGHYSKLHYFQYYVQQLANYLGRITTSKAILSQSLCQFFLRKNVQKFGCVIISFVVYLHDRMLCLGCYDTALGNTAFFWILSIKKLEVCLYHLWIIFKLMKRNSSKGRIQDWLWKCAWGEKYRASFTQLRGFISEILLFQALSIKKIHVKWFSK